MRDEIDSVKAEIYQPMDSEVGDRGVCMLVCVNALAGGFIIPIDKARRYIEENIVLRTDHYNDWGSAQCKLCPASFIITDNGSVIWRNGSCQAMSVIANHLEFPE